MPQHHRSLGSLLGVAWLVWAASAAGDGGFATVGTRIVWDDLFSGTRSESMGQADLAVARGPMAFLVTPAPLPNARAAQAGYGKLGYVSGLDLHQYGLAARLGPASGWQWTVGVGHRGFRFAFGDEVTHANGVDFGSSARYRRALDWAQLSASLAGVIHNVGNSAFVPRDTRLGLALSLAVDADRRAEAVVVTVGYVAEDSREIEASLAHSYLGVETTLLQVVSFRLGRDRQLFGGSSQYGIGVTIPPRWTQPYGLKADWGSMGLGDAPLFDEGPRDMVSVTVTREL